MVKTNCINEVIFIGTVVEPPKYHHNDIKNNEYYELIVASKRKSGVEDVIPVVVDKETVEKLQLKKDTRIRVKGDFRSYKNYGNRKLMLYIFAKEIEETIQEDYNIIKFEGYICKKGVLRTTPMTEKNILDLFVATNRSKNKSSYIPCIIWGLDKESSEKFSVGDFLKIRGRIQSRVYEKVLENGERESRIAYEVSVINFSQHDSE